MSPAKTFARFESDQTTTDLHMFLFFLFLSALSRHHVASERFIFAPLRSFCYTAGGKHDERTLRLPEVGPV